MPTAGGAAYFVRDGEQDRWRKWSGQLDGVLEDFDLRRLDAMPLGSFGHRCSNQVRDGGRRERGWKCRVQREAMGSHDVVAAW